MFYAFDIAKRYFRAKKRGTISVITAVAIGGVALGVAALLTVLSITTGFQEEFRNKVLGVNAHVLVLKYGIDFVEYRDVMAKAKAMPEVDGSSPFLIHEMMLSKGDRISGVLVKGIDPKRALRILDIQSQITQGSFDRLRLPGSAPAVVDKGNSGAFVDDQQHSLDNYLKQLSEGDTKKQEAKALEAPEARPIDGAAKVKVPSPEHVENLLAEDEAELPEFDDALFADDDEQTLDLDPERLPGVVVGHTLARTLQLAMGDVVHIVSPLAGLDNSLWAPSSDADQPVSHPFRVSGIFKAGFQEYDSRLVYVDLYQAQRFFERGDAVTGVEITLHDYDRARDVAQRLDRAMGEGPIYTMDWAELNHNLFTALEIQKIMLSLVIATIIFVAAFNVIATLIMIVLEKKREIAILKAIGARNSSILSIFMVQGAVIGAVGTLLGILLGGGICAYLLHYQFPLDPKVYLIDHVPIRISASEFGMTILISLVICMTATLFPSWWAARMQPAQGVRYE